MAPNTHRVRRQTWRLRVGSDAAAFAALARLRGDVEALWPPLSKVFDAWASPDVVLRIPRLQVHLQIPSLDELDGAFEEALHGELSARDADPATPTIAAQYRTILLGYLESGTLDWPAALAEATESIATLRAALLAGLRSVVDSVPVSGAGFARAWQCYARLLQLLPEEHWSAVAAMLDAGKPSPGPDARQLDTSDGVEVEPAIDAILATRGRIGSSLTLSLAAASLAAARTGAFRRRGLDALALLCVGSATVPDVLAAIAPTEPGNAEARRAAESPHDRAPPRDIADQAPVVAGSFLPSDHRTHAAAQPFPLSCANAGLVLLHGYLPTLFEACGLYRKAATIESSELPRAAALLHWLAVGRDDAHEFELDVVKVLLGLQPESALPAVAGLLGEAERAEGVALLRAAIGHWSALKNTSVDALRISFLQRRGLLYEDDGAWRLRIAPESFDLLLRQLPWGFATVRLPWMTQPLFTDWPTP